MRVGDATAFTALGTGETIIRTQCLYTADSVFLSSRWFDRAYRICAELKVKLAASWPEGETRGDRRRKP